MLQIIPYGTLAKINNMQVTVLTCKISRTTIVYECSYWNQGNHYIEDFDSSEIVLNKKVSEIKIGFLK